MKNMSTAGTVAVVMVITIIAAFILRAKMDAMEDKMGKEQTEAVETVQEEETVVSPIEGAKEYYNSAEKISIEKVERRSVNDGDGNIETEYKSYIVSDIDLTECVDSTAEYADALKEDGFDDSGVKKGTFMEAFDFSYDGMDVWDIYERILSDNGIDADLDSGVLDKEEEAISKRSVYDLKGCSIIPMLLSGEKYDSVLEEKVYYQTEEIDGACVPQSFTAEVVLSCGNKTITKSLYIQMVVEDIKEGADEEI